MIRDQIAADIRQAIANAQQAGDLPAIEIPAVAVERPKKVELADFASSVALQLSKLAGRKPLEIAQAIVTHLPKADYQGKVTVAAPGFINFTFGDAWLGAQVGEILAAGETFGNLNIGQGRRAQVEFISSNPTGPVHAGGARNAVLGDVIANLLSATGWQVSREFYINDAGRQVRLFGESIYARYAQALGQTVPFPEEGYRGEYVVELAQALVQEHGDRFLHLPHDEAVNTLKQLGLQWSLKGVKHDAERLGIHFDVWFSESSLYTGGEFEHIMAVLQEKSLVGEREGATWFLGTKLGANKDEVLIRRSEGGPTYFASDIAYHYNKFIERGFDRVVDVWSVDHQGSKPRLHLAMREIFDITADRFDILLYNLVRLMRQGQEVRLSKRAGNMITVSAVLDEVGPDSVRFILLTRSNEQTIDFDLDLVKQQSDENPVYYVQYAHARCVNILLKFAERYPDEGRKTKDENNFSLLVHPSEQALIRKLLELPEVVENAVLKLAPHGLTYYAQAVASHLAAFYRDCHVINEPDPALRLARLQLVNATRLVLARTLGLMGMSTPERM